MKKLIKFLFGKDVWVSKTGVMIATAFLSLIWFVVDWCNFTTFRAMSDWLLYVNNFVAAVLLTVPFMISKRIWVQVLFLLVADCLFMANLIYCRTYFTAIPPQSYALASNMADFTASIFTSLRWLDLGFPLILAAGVAVAGRVANSPRGGWKHIAVTGLLAALISCSAIMCRGGFYKAYDTLTQSCYYYTCGVPTYTIAGHIAYNVMSEANSTSPEARAKVDEWLADHSRLMPHTALPDSIARRTNLVVIICESLESWPLEAEIEGKEITPYLNSLIADSTTLYAPHLLTQVASGRSIDFQLMLNTGLLPMKGTVYSMKFPSATYPSLNKAMAAKYGARSILFTCDKPITWNQEAISRAFGYDSLIDRRNWRIDELVGNPGKLSDGSFMRQSVEKLKANNLWPEGSPAMLTFVTYSGHSPFVLPDKMKDPSFDISAAGLPDKITDYVTMAHYTDSQLHTIVDYIKSRPDYANTLIVITGDHEGLASLRREARQTSEAARRLVDEAQYTPLLVLNSPVTGRIDKTVGQIDIYPTLLNLMGLDDYGWKGLGQSILSPGHPGVAVSSMTMEMRGDTTALSPELLHHINGAMPVSDAMIRMDYFKE